MCQSYMSEAFVISAVIDHMTPALLANFVGSVIGNHMIHDATFRTSTISYL